MGKEFTSKKAHTKSSKSSQNQNQSQSLSDLRQIDGQHLSQNDILYLQRTIGNQAVNNLLNGSQSIQRYQEVTEGRLTYFVSQNGRYAIAKNDKYSLYVRNGEAAPHYCKPLQHTQQIAGHTYTLYVAVDRFFKDCLHTAEEIMKEQQLRQGGDQSRVAGTNTKFGTSDANNKRAANAFARDNPRRFNDYAQANVGQALAIVETGDKLGESGFPYHAAAVIAKDNTDMITLEVEAGTKDAKLRNTNGTFEMYNGNPDDRRGGMTFHTQQGSGFNVPVTITIEAIPDR